MCGECFRAILTGQRVYTLRFLSTLCLELLHRDSRTPAEYGVSHIYIRLRVCFFFPFPLVPGTLGPLRSVCLVPYHPIKLSPYHPFTLSPQPSKLLSRPHHLIYDKNKYQRQHLHRLRLPNSIPILTDRPRLFPIPVRPPRYIS